MLDSLTQQPADALLALIKLYDADNRADKIDLGVGVFRTETGATPVFGAIKEAEKRLLAEQDSKAYLGPEGDMGFVHALMPYIFGVGDPAQGGRIDGMQAPGGTGALRLAFALAKRAGIRRIVVGNPTWPNHPQILDDLGLETPGFCCSYGPLVALKRPSVLVLSGDAVIFGDLFSVLAHRGFAVRTCQSIPFNCIKKLLRAVLPARSTAT